MTAIEIARRVRARKDLLASSEEREHRLRAAGFDDVDGERRALNLAVSELDNHGAER